MALTKTPICDFGKKADNFELKSTDNKVISLNDIKGENGTLIMFICNHCPYVKAVIQNIVEDCKKLEDNGIKSVAICSNDVKNYPEDSFDNMIKFSKNHNFNFPYVIDETQEVAKAYSAVCTPDIFLYNKDRKLEYRGRLDDNWQQPHNVTREELRMAIDMVLNGDEIDFKQVPSMGCNIKWK